MTSELIQRIDNYYAIVKDIFKTFSDIKNVI